MVCVLLDHTLKSLIHKFSTFSGLPGQNSTFVSEYLKEGNGDHKYLRCPVISEYKFDILRSEIALDKIDLDCAETVKYNAVCFS